MAPFIFDDAPKDFRQHGIRGPFGKQAVAFKCGQLLDGAPSQIRGGQLRREPAEKHRRYFFERDPRCERLRHRNITCFEEMSQCAAVKELFVRPAREEGRDFGIVDRAGVQQSAQVNDGVRFDIHHVRQAADFVGVKWELSGGGEIDSGQV